MPGPYFFGQCACSRVYWRIEPSSLECAAIDGSFVISYAQNFEDVLLNRAFGGESGYYIDVGAMDPVECSVTKAFYDRGWSGINIEPDVRFYTKLVAERQRDINLNIAVGEAEEARTFYAFEAEGISTFRESARDYFVKRNYPCTEVSCGLTTLAHICEEYVRCPIDFLKIDAEGWEGPILRGGDWRKFRPVVLVIEATEPCTHIPAWTEWEPFLTGECQYNFVYFDGLNRFYVREESRELETRFAFPANVLDNFQTYPLVLAERRAAEARARVEQLEIELASRTGEVQLLTGEVDKARSQIANLQQALNESRFWVGRLSERLAANGIR